MIVGSKTDLFVSVVALLDDRPDVLAAFVGEIHRLLDDSFTNYEILLIHNGSNARLQTGISRILADFKCVRYLRLFRPVDVETALTAGLDAAIGDYVVTIHPDFDPVNELLPMLDSCMSGNDVVLGMDRKPPTAGITYVVLRRMFLFVSQWLLNMTIPVGATEYRVFSRNAVNAITRSRTRRRYFAVLASNIGLTTANHFYDRISRSGRTWRPRLRPSIRTGLSILVHYSMLPLRLVALLGLAGSGLSLAYSLYVVIVYLFKPDVMPGWTTMSLQVSGLFTLVFLMLGLLSESVGRVLEEGTDRPLYHIQDEQFSAVMLSDATRRNVLQHEADGRGTNPPNG